MAISGTKGGVGKTTTALHLAGFLASRGKTLLVDADANRSALEFAARGTGLPFLVVSQDDARQYAGQHPHMVLDLPANPAEADLLGAAAGADLVILPTIADAMSVSPILRLQPRLAGAAYRVLVTIAPTGFEKDGEQARDALAAAGVPVFRTVVHRRAAFKHAANAGELVAGGEYDQVGQEVLEIVGG